MKKNLLNYFGLLSVFCLSACSAGPDYVKPDVKTPNSFKYAQKEKKTAPFQEGWWRVFDDVLLNQLIETAMTGNYDIKAALERVNQARSVADVSRSSFFPSLTTNPSAEKREYSETLDSGGGITTKTYRVPLNVFYELDLFGRVRRGYEAARANAQVVEEDFKSALLVLQADIALNYFAMRSLDDEIRIVSRIYKIREEQLKLMNRRHEFGVISKLPIAQAKAELNATQSLLLSLQRERAKLENAIGVLLGKAPSEVSLRYDPLKETPPHLPSVLPSRLLTARPDIRRVERQLTAENARIGVATAAFYPQITLGADVGWASSHSSDLFDTRSYTWGIGPNIHLPLFEGGKNIASLKQAQARYAEVYATYRQTIIRAFGEVEDALISANLLKKQADANQQATAESETAYKLSKKQFEGGLVNYLSVLDTERTYLDNMRLSSQIRRQEYASAVSLIKAIGGKW